jgi:hypothetical protein
MSPVSKREYIEAVFRRYKYAKRQEKKTILDELCANCGFHRKHAVRVLRNWKQFTKPKKKRPGRRSTYNSAEIVVPLKKIWLAANLPCSKRLKSLLPLWLPGYQEMAGALSENVLAILGKISPATIDRILKPTRLKYTKHGRCTTKPGTLIRNQIPIGTNQWDQTRPGFIEADTVAHCGGSMAGQFVFTVDCVDIATGWTEQRAVWGKGETDVLEKIRDIEAKLPFELLGFDSDNGTEFLNYHLLRHFSDRERKVQFTRSRAYRKDDNAHIEQKNWTHVRQWLGYDRFDNPEIVPLLNDLYTTEWRLFHNFFCSSVKLIEKKQIGSKTIKRHDSPKTPYQRLLESPYIDPATKQSLQEQCRSLNPFHLRKEIEKKIKKIFQLCYKADGLKTESEVVG